MLKKLLLLGATGSIGSSCIRLIRDNKINVELAALVAFRDSKEIKDLAEEFSCPYYLNTNGTEALKDFIDTIDFDICLNAIAGAEGFKASAIILKKQKDLALANKESIVMGASYLKALAKENGVKIIPVDSEHSAAYSLINKHKQDLASVVITASGGPFLNRESLDNISVEEALNHPTWKMGNKITIDSATLANKGLEVIEAGYLFDLSAKDIQVVIHPQSVMHAAIRLKNGAVYAQLSPPDMMLPIALSLDEEVLEDIVTPLSFDNLNLSFQKPDMEKFKMLKLAYICLEKGNSYPIAYNAANEIAVAHFLDRKIEFNKIPEIVEQVLEMDYSASAITYDEILKQDLRARNAALSLLQ